MEVVSLPWKNSTVTDERERFIREYRCGYSISELCREFGISRVTGHKWITRFLKDGPKGLLEQSRAPKNPRFKVSPEAELLILEAKRLYPKWGPQKLLDWLKAQRQIEGPWPACSTFGQILSRHNLVRSRKRRRRVERHEQPQQPQLGPNELWSADFKGWFKALNGERCDPLTISDHFSRYLLGCEVVDKTGYERVWPVFESAFREYGLPLAIRTDNGAPFASRGLFGWSKLSLQWLKLGIRHERIEPGQPQQNGRHERIHRTMLEVTSPASSTRIAQQAAFDRWRCEYNEQRPHAALPGHCTPASVYTLSPRQMPRRIPELEYDSRMLLRKVGANGEIYWKHQTIFVSEVLSGEVLGLSQCDNDLYSLWAGSLRLGAINIRSLKFHPDPDGPQAVEMPSW
jgi:putative transposase